MKEYHVIFKGGLKVLVIAQDLIEASHQALTNLSKSPDEIISISEVLHYFKQAQVVESADTADLKSVD